MSHYATLRGHKFEGASADVRGANLYGEGGKKLARVHDVVFDLDGGDIRYLVAAYGHSRRVLVPIERVVANGSGFSSNLTCEDLDHLPAFDDNLLTSGQWNAYEALHRSALDGVPQERLVANNVTYIDRAQTCWTGFQQQLRRELPRLQRDSGDYKLDKQKIA